MISPVTGVLTFANRYESVALHDFCAKYLAHTRGGDLRNLTPDQTRRLARVIKGLEVTPLGLNHLPANRWPKIIKALSEKSAAGYSFTWNDSDGRGGEISVQVSTSSHRLSGD